MTAPVSLLPQLTGALLPPPNPVTGLSDDERNLIVGLSTKLALQAVGARLRYLYYDGEQRMQSFGISIPSVMSNVRQVVDWPRICVDRLVERAGELDGFRLPSSTEIDTELREHWQANDLDAELPLAIQDALVVGRGYGVVGSPDAGGGSPCVTIESPFNMTVEWDPRTQQIIAAYQSYEAEGVYRASLYLPDVTISMSRDETQQWVIDERDEHRFGEVPVVRFVNRARSSDREGRSQITAAIMSTTDSACRSLLGMEIAREVYSVPRLALLGSKESAFVDSAGNAKSAIDMAMTKILAFERDNDGQLPQIQQLTAFDPSVFTKVIDEHAQLMASYTGFPPSYFGQTTTANPSSADAIRVGLEGLERGAKRVQLQSTPPTRKLGQLMWRFAHNGDPLPAEMTRLQPDWVETATPTPAATTDAVAKQIAEGSIPATSDVTLKKLGYSAVDRARLAQDRQLDPAMAIVTALANSIVTKLARADNAIAKDLEEGGAITAALGDELAASPLPQPQPPAAPKP